ncbi:MAG TPA: ornithine cyclodeaminase family protein [Candidatus Eisenbacteria bacterium]|nr:ornithine cyclodeaminase family protein [Candidatus Eisenbacteria bacterium]
MRVITQSEVGSLLPMDECMDVMRDALMTLARGDAVLPLRNMVRLPERPGPEPGQPGPPTGLLGLMPAYLGSPAVIGLKVVTVMPGNHGTAYDSHQGAVMIFEVEHGCPLAVIDASSITAIRTAAVSGVATRLLAREDAGDLALLGSGTQAVTHLEAMRVARSLRRVRVWSRDPERARAFAEREGARQGLSVEVASTARAAVDGADLVCTTTAAREPVLEGAWLAPGVHINAVGACFKDTRELDTAAVAACRLYVDRRESTMNESGDFLMARAEGAITDAHIVGELGEALLGSVPGRRAPHERTLFKSLGIAIEDLAAAHHIWRKAEQLDQGTAVEFGGLRPEVQAAR